MAKALSHFVLNIEFLTYSDSTCGSTSVWYDDSDIKTLSEPGDR